MEDKLDKAKEAKNNSGGIGFFGALTILFIALKLIGIIAWPWIWVVATLWIPLAAVLAIAFIALIIYLIAN